MMDWSAFYPAFVATAGDQENDMTHNTKESKAISARLTKQIEVADIGCGFGGLLVALGPRFPDTLFLGTRLVVNPTSSLYYATNGLIQEWKSA
jgi:tRNA (guanine-N7-)-methyltransferase